MSLENMDNIFKQTVLVVDDNVANLRVISQCLKQSGYRVLTAKDGKSALEKARGAKPDLILLDVMMPEMNGFETCRRLKNEKDLLKIPVIFMTALTSVEDKVKAFKLGAVDYITKPFQTEEVMARVQTHLNLRELTERLETQAKELAKAKELAETANAHKSEFLARMSHEIRTPLNAVTGFTHLVLNSHLTDEQRNYLNKVKFASNDLLDVINDILDFSKVEAGQLELTDAPFNLEHVLQHQIDLFSDRAAQKSLELNYTIAPDVPRQLIGDAGRLTQILTNLIGNAIKFTETGEISVHVEMDQMAFQDHIQAVHNFSVRDTGVGIADETLPTLFDPFTQVDDSLTRKHQGSGLGLAICRQLAELMGGRIWATSTPGQGSTFSFVSIFKPMVEGADIPTQDPVQESDMPLIPDLSGSRVLVVDDRELNLELAVALLDETGLTVETAENGSLSVTKVAGSPLDYFDAVLMDVQMPVMDGYEATRKIRELEANTSSTDSRIPIIAMTGHALKGEKEKCLAAGMDDYLPKPIQMADLYRTLLKWIA